MKIEHDGNNLRVSDIPELNAVNASSFREEVRAAMPKTPESIEIDLSQTNFVDSCGLGALISLHKATCNRNGTVRLVNPTAPVQQILELTRLYRVLEVVQRGDVPAGVS